MKSKSPRKKPLLLLLYGVVAISLGYLIIDNLKLRIDQYIEEYNQTVPEEIGMLVAAKVEDVMIPATSGFQLQEYAKNDDKRKAARKTLNLAKDASAIKEIWLINSDNQIVISTAEGLEGSRLQDAEDVENLTTRTPKVIPRAVGETIEELDIIWPVIIDEKFQGHIRTFIQVKKLPALEEMRTAIIWGSGIAVASLIFLALTLGWRSSKPGESKQPATEKTAEPAAETPAPERQSNQARSNGASSVFSKLNELYDQSGDLDKSFQESEQRINSMMRVLNQGLLILDLNMRIITSNEYILDLFHIRTKSSEQRKVYELLQKNPRLLEIYRRAKDPLTEQVKQIFFLTLLNGRKINIEVLARPFYNGEDVAGVTFYLKNLDMLNELEQTLQRSMKYGVISQLSSSIGHEIRNPLSSLAIHTEIVDNMVSKSVDDEIRLKKIKKSITILNSEVERLQKLIDQFFKLAKTQEISLTFENMSDLMNDIHDLVHQQALENNIRITTDFSNDLPLVKVSKDQLKQVIINLILNGFDAMADSGDMLISTLSREGYVVISIQDNGCGIPDHVKDNIFDLYFTTKDSGGGIGLAISRKIIEAHEGKLYFESKVGVGTVFYIELPTFQN